MTKLATNIDICFVSFDLLEIYEIVSDDHQNALSVLTKLKCICR